MNDTTLTGPCADYEHDLVELLDGALPARAARSCSCTSPSARAAARGPRIRRPRCQARGGAAAARTVRGFRVPAAGADRVADAAGRARRRRAQLELEHESLVDALRRAARRRALLGAAGSCRRPSACCRSPRRARADEAQLHAALGGAGWCLGTIGVRSRWRRWRGRRAPTRCRCRASVAEESPAPTCRRSNPGRSRGRRR